MSFEQPRVIGPLDRTSSCWHSELELPRAIGHLDRTSSCWHNELELPRTIGPLDWTSSCWHSLFWLICTSLLYAKESLFQKYLACHPHFMPPSVLIFLYFSEKNLIYFQKELLGRRVSRTVGFGLLSPSVFFFFGHEDRKFLQENLNFFLQLPSNS